MKIEKSLESCVTRRSIGSWVKSEGGHQGHLGQGSVGVTYSMLWYVSSPTAGALGSGQFFENECSLHCRSSHISLGQFSRHFYPFNRE